MLRHPGDAEDAAQQAFLSAYRALLNGSQPREPAAWLVTIARNECLRRARARMREPLSTLDMDAAVGAPDPAVTAAGRAELSALLAAIDALPPMQRDALLLRELGGLSYDQLARELAVSRPAVESLLFRARQRLREHIRCRYAALAPASWIESLLRLLSASAPAAATKVVALGVGAAALTGGTAAIPHLLDHERALGRRAAPAIEHARRPPPPGRPAPASPPRPVLAAAAVVPTRRVSQNRDEHRKSLDRSHVDSGGSDGAQTAFVAADRGPVAQSRTEADELPPTPPPTTTDAASADATTTDTSTTSSDSATTPTGSADGSTSENDQTTSETSGGGSD